MNPFKSISEGYKRWRHSHGFGVHSPFAYDLIKSVISPGQYGYYGYRDIDMELLKPRVKVYPTIRKDARLLLRLLINLNISRLILPKGGHPVFATAAKAAGIVAAASLPHDSGKRFLRNRRADEGTILLLTGNTISEPGVAARSINDGTVILAFDPSAGLREEIKAAMTDGLILEGTRTLLAIPRPEMALTYYTVRM